MQSLLFSGFGEEVLTMKASDDGIDTLQAAFSSLLFSEEKSISIKNAVKKLNPHYFVPGKQHCADEFLDCLFEKISTSDIETQIMDHTMSMDDSSPFVQQETVVEKIFALKSKESVYCDTCRFSHEQDKSEICLKFQSENRISVQNIIDKNIIGQVATCPKCGYQNAFAKIDIVRHPEILRVGFYRTHFDSKTKTS